MSTVRLATMWLEACSGCHMSFLDMDERLIDLAAVVQLLYGPLADAKEFPDDVDVAVIEGGVGNEHQLELLHQARERSRILVALGDCAVTGNVPSMRNMFDLKDITSAVYGDAPPPGSPDGVPVLRPLVEPQHRFVKVDAFISGCPPSADLIYSVLSEIIQGRAPAAAARARFG